MKSIHAFRAWQRYGLAFLVTGAGVLLTLALWPIVQPTPAILLILAIFLSAWYGGVGPSVLSALLSVLALVYVILPPGNSLTTPSVYGVIDLVIFAAIILLINIGAARARQARALERAARLEAERNFARVGYLQAITAALAHALSPQQVAEVVIGQALPALGAAGGAAAVLTVNGAEFEIIAHAGLPVDRLQAYRRFPAASALPIADAVRQRDLLLLPNPETILSRYPALAGDSSSQAAAVIPFLLEGAALGAMTLTFNHSQVFTSADREFMLAIGRQCALALDRAQAFRTLQDSVRERSQALEAANSRLQAEAQEREQAQAQLAASYAQLRALADDLQQAREEERRRVSRELHDVLGGALTALKLTAARLQRQPPGGPQAAATVSEVLGQVDDAIGLVRRLATNLRPALLDALGLPAALHGLAQDFGERAGLDCQFETQLDELALDPNTAIALYRVAQESLTNVARHAQATQVRLCLAEEAGALVLRVADNGRGFDPAAADQGRTLGLAGMRERLHPFAGRLEIVSALGGGTTVTVNLPRPPQPAPAPPGHL